MDIPWLILFSKIDWKISMNNSRIIEWINNCVTKNSSSTQLNSIEIENVLHFSLLWNIFEDVFWTRSNSPRNPNDAFSLRKVHSVVEANANKLDESIITPIFCYFHNRYQDNKKFKALKFRHNEKETEDKLLSMLSSAVNINLNHKAYFISSIIYRFRNNLFHGEKQMIKISLQEENFQNANEFLMHFIEKCKGEL